MTETSHHNSIVTMEHMPPEILDNILRNLKPIEKLICKKVCRKFYGSVNRLNPGFLTIEVYTRAIRYYGLQMISYRNRGNNCVVRYAGKTKIIENSNYLDVMIRDLFSVLRNQKLNLKVLSFSCDDNSVFEKIHELAVRIDLTNIRTEHLSIMTNPVNPALTTIFNIVNYNDLQLSNIEADIENTNLQLLARRYREIFELVPTYVNVKLCVPWFETFPAESFSKFRRIELNFTSFAQPEFLNCRVIGNIIQNLLTSDVLDSCVLSAEYQKDDVIKVLTDEIKLQGNENVFEVRTPDKNERYSVELLEKEIKITRTGI